MLLVFIDFSIVVLRVLILFYFVLTRHISEKKHLANKSFIWHSWKAASRDLKIKSTESVLLLFFRHQSLRWGVYERGVIDD